jgi:hypothetical protein
MALGHNTLRAIPTLRNYKDASKREADTTPIRGRTPEVKPLGSRKQTYFSIRREPDESIVLVSGSYVFMRFRPNDDVLLYDATKWGKSTDNDLRSEVTHMNIQTFQTRVWVTIGGVSSYLRQGENVENIFRYENNRWTYLNPPTITKHVVNRKGAKEVRARYVPFMTYMNAMIKVRGDSAYCDTDEVAAAFDIELTEHERRRSYMARIKLPPLTSSHRFDHEEAATLCELMASEDIHDHYKAYVWLMQDRDHDINKPIMMHHHKEMLEVKEVETRAKTYDVNAWAVPR